MGSRPSYSVSPSRPHEQGSLAALSRMAQDNRQAQVQDGPSSICESRGVDFTQNGPPSSPDECRDRASPCRAAVSARGQTVEPTRWRVGGQDAPPCRRLRPDPGGGLVSPTSDEHSAAARRVQVRPRDAGALVGSVWRVWGCVKFISRGALARGFRVREWCRIEFVLLMVPWRMIWVPPCSLGDLGIWDPPCRLTWRRRFRLHSVCSVIRSSLFRLIEQWARGSGSLQGGVKFHLLAGDWLKSEWRRFGDFLIKSSSSIISAEYSSA